MKKSLFFLVLTILLCGGCKYFKKSSEPEIIKVDSSSEEVIDSSAYYNNLNEGNITNEVAATTPVATGNKYYMIVGCFTVSANADKYAEKLRGMGYESQILAGNNNFQMVAARSYNNYRESIGEIDKFRNEVTPNAWVYVKR